MPSLYSHHLQVRPCLLPPEFVVMLALPLDQKEQLQPPESCQCVIALVSLLRFHFFKNRQIKERFPDTCSVLPFSHSSACWLVSPSCIFKKRIIKTKKHVGPLCPLLHSSDLSPDTPNTFCFVYLICVLQSVAFCTILPSTLLVFSPFGVGGCRQGLLGLLVVPWGEGK